MLSLWLQQELAPVKKKRRVVKVVKKEDESPVKNEEEIDGDPAAASPSISSSFFTGDSYIVKIEEEETEVKEGIGDDLQVDRDEPCREEGERLRGRVERGWRG
jgi:hypothetical protein